MQEILGKERIQLLVFMFVLNAGLISVYYYYIQPIKQDADREYSNMRTQAQKRHNDVRELRKAFAELLPKIADYKKLQTQGFFNNQKRTIARDTINAHRESSKLLEAKYEIKPAKVIEDARAEQADHAIISSPLNIEIKALDDVDIYMFLALIQNDFPGNLDLREMKIERQSDLSLNLLENIASGEPEVMMKADVKLNWRSMVSKSELNEP